MKFIKKVYKSIYKDTHNFFCPGFTISYPSVRSLSFGVIYPKLKKAFASGMIKNDPQTSTVLISFSANIYVIALRISPSPTTPFITKFFTVLFGILAHTYIRHQLLDWHRSMMVFSLDKVYQASKLLQHSQGFTDVLFLTCSKYDSDFLCRAFS